MCLILDTNKFSDFLDAKNEDMRPVRDWLNKGDGKIVYSPTLKMQQELERHEKMRKLFDQYRESGKLKIFVANEVDKRIRKLLNLKSDDPDIIALAQVSGVTLLVSNDVNLHADFGKIVGGKIYQNKNHKHLLKKKLCP